MTILARILEAKDADAISWESFYRELPLSWRSIHFSPGYARVQEVATGESAYCAVAYDERSTFVMQPFMLRGEHGQRVMESLYGYGGPATNATGDYAGSLFIRMESALAAFRLAHRVVCERAVLAPQISSSQHRLYARIGVVPRATKQVVIVPANAKVCRAGMSEKRVAAVTKALKDGIVAKQVVFIGQPLTRFTELYNGTMDRVKAAPRWRYPRAYFEAHFRELPHRVTLVQASMKPNDFTPVQVVSSAMVLMDGLEAQYQFAGNSGVSGASDLVILEAVAAAQAAGCATLDLGGGVTAAEDDSVFWYKSTFSDRRRQVSVVERVFDQARFDELSEGRPRDFFPPWRAGARIMEGTA